MEREDYERDDYIAACLRTWADDDPEQYQLAHAAMMLMDEWREYKDAEASSRFNEDELVDEVGDLYYALAMLTHLTGESAYIPANAMYGSSIKEVDKVVGYVHDLVTKIAFRADKHDYYDKSALQKELQTQIICLADELSGLCKKLEVSVDTVLAKNIRKLSDRHG